MLLRNRITDSEETRKEERQWKLNSFLVGHDMTFQAWQEYNKVDPVKI